MKRHLPPRGQGPPPMMMDRDPHRAPPRGGRGGPPPFPGRFFPGRGGFRGPPGGFGMVGRGPNIGERGMHGRGPPPNMRPPAPPMGRGMFPPIPMGGRGNMGMGRGRMGLGPGPPGPRPPMPAGSMGRPILPSRDIPPPPPRPGGGHPPFIQQMPRPHGIPPPNAIPPPNVIPPPPLRGGFPIQSGQQGNGNVNIIGTRGFNQPQQLPPPSSGVAGANQHMQLAHSVRTPQVAPAATASYPAISTPVGPTAGAIGNNHNNQIGPTQQATTPTTAHSKDQIDMAWNEYDGPSGVKYYHNSITKESTYTKPDVLARKDESPATNTNIPNGSQWKEYEDANTGKKYYSDGVTTTWEKPAGFQSEDIVPVADESSSPPPKKKKKEIVKKVSEFSNKAEAIAAFKGLLLAKGIAPTLKWNDVVKLCSSDARWSSCEDALSVGERRQALAEYQTKRKNELRDQERQERARAKEAFGQLLTELLPSITGFSAWSSRFPDVRASLSKDDRFYAVEDESARESLFLDFCEEFRKRDERKKRSRKREAQDAFLAFLAEKEEAGSLTFASTWGSFMSSLVEDDKKDPRLQTSAVMSDSDRQLHFADFVIALQAAEDEKRRRIRDARRRAEKAQREGYRELLRKMAGEGHITPYTRWRSVEETVSVHDSFKLVEAQDRDCPREIFEEFLDEWGACYREDRSFLIRLMSSGRKEIRVKAGTSYDQFTKLLLDEASYSPDVYGDLRRIIVREQPRSSARLYYDELMFHTSSNDRRTNDDSSADEGEIIEEGEVSESSIPASQKAAPPSKGQGWRAGNSTGKVDSKIVSQDNRDCDSDQKATNTPSETGMKQEISSDTKEPEANVAEVPTKE